MSRPDTESVYYVSPDIIRKKFDEGPYAELIKNGKLRSKVIGNRHLPNPATFQGPFCTHSQAIRYYDDNRWLIVEIHQYLRPDGTLGASGKPDPKRLRSGDTLLAVRARPSS
jgi:hypothetical protein